jgi:hypothetical protein
MRCPAISPTVAQIFTFVPSNRIEMNLQTEKLELMRLILETESEGIVKAAKNLFKSAKAEAELWESLPQEHRNDILEGIREIEAGQVVDYQTFMLQHPKRLKKELQ